MTTSAPATRGARRATRRRPRDLSFGRVSFFAVFLVLPLLLYVYLVISPIIQSFFYSMTNWTGFDPNP